MKRRYLILALLILSIGVASAKTIYFTIPWYDPSHTIIGYKDALVAVKTPLKGSEYWEWQASPDSGHIAYFDLYIPEASTRDVYLTVTWGDDGYGYTGIHVYASQEPFPDWSSYAYLNWSRTPAIVQATSSYVSVYMDSTPGFEKTAKIRIPSGCPYVRVLLWDNDRSGNLKVRLWEKGDVNTGTAPPTTPTPTPTPYTPPTSPLTAWITDVYGFTLTAFATGVGILVYATRGWWKRFLS